ncbi:hypothetical protein [Nonomuraea sp. NPDC050691]
MSDRFEGVPAYVECAVRADAAHEYVFLRPWSGGSSRARITEHRSGPM